ncbi:tyrosine-type recombinase/integrase [Luteimonas viscosa]|nr:tyrosine-type recombinase/integrase [Luteimonas viscosa]
MAKTILTDAYIRNRPRPAKGNAIDYDTETKGLAVRFTKSAGAALMFCYGSSVAGGSARRMVLGPWSPASGRSIASVLPAMRKEAIRLAGIVAEGRDPYAERKAEAERLAAEREAERIERERAAAEAEAARSAEEARLTVSQLLALYLDPEEGATLTSDTLRRTRRRANRYIVPALGNRKADTLEQGDVLNLIKPLRRAGKRSEVVHLVSLISGLYTWGLTERHLAKEKNPAGGILAILDKADELPEARERALTTAADFRAFWCITDPFAEVPPAKRMNRDVAECLRFMLYTGARPSEAAGLRWVEVDMAAAVWNKPKQGEGRAKSKRGDTLPLVAPAMAILRSRHGNASDYVFPSGRSRRIANGGGQGCLTANRLATGLREAIPYLQSQGVEPFTPHDVRRTLATGMNEIGVSSDVVERTLNHAMGKLKKTYDKSRQTRIRRRAMTAWADYFAEVVRTGKTIDDWEDDALPQTDNVLQFPAMPRGR